MLKRILSGMLLLSLLISPAIALGVQGVQGVPLGKWWHNPRVSKQVNLNKDEIRRLDESFIDSRRKLIDLKSKLERQRFELENLLERETLNEAAAMEQFKRVESARNRLATERFSFLIQVRKILGFERYQNLKMLYEKFRHQKRRQMTERPMQKK